LRETSAAQTRERVIQAARKLLSAGEEGQSFSLEAVARAAGVTRVTVYHQFESKRGLLEAVFDSLAHEGGLFELPKVFSEPVLGAALRQVVSLFCRFWGSHGRAVPRVMAFARLDKEIAESMRERSERRRHLLRALVGRCSNGRPSAELVDLLFALTSFEFYESLQARNRGDVEVERMIQELVEDAVRRHSGSVAF
jgi:AcrR family transcriptional regulator